VECPEAKKEHKKVKSIARNVLLKDGDARGCYALLAITEDGQLSVEFIRFEYDVEKAAQVVTNSLLPDYYAETLRKAI
jgi:hypothetical protein